MQLPGFSFRYIVAFFAIEFALVALVLFLGQSWWVFAALSVFLFFALWVHDNWDRMEPWHLITMGLAGVWLFATVALVGVIWQNYKPNKTQNIEITSAPDKVETKPKSELEWGFEVHRMSPIGLSAPEGKILVTQFFGQGRNQTKDPIVKARGYVRSDKTNKEFPILFSVGRDVLVTADEINPIPVGALITTKAFFSPDQKPLPIETFLAEFVPFTFFFQYDGKEYRHTFTLEDIEPDLLDYEREVRMRSLKTPQMTAKSGAQSSLVNEAYWPPLTDVESKALTEKLRPLVSTKMFLSCSQVECRELARSLLAAFKAAGWQDIKLSTGGLEAVGVEGVQIFPSDGPAPQLREVIESTTDLSVTLMEVDRKFSDYTGYYLIIGSKPF